MTKTVALIIRPVGNRYQVLLPGNILVKEVKNRWDAFKVSITEEEKDVILKRIADDLAIAKRLGEPTQNTTKAVPIALVDPDPSIKTKEENAAANAERILAEVAKEPYKLPRKEREQKKRKYKKHKGTSTWQQNQALVTPNQ